MSLLYLVLIIVFAGIILGVFSLLEHAIGRELKRIEKALNAQSKEDLVSAIKVLVSASYILRFMPSFAPVIPEDDGELYYYFHLHYVEGYGAGRRINKSTKIMFSVLLFLPLGIFLLFFWSWSSLVFMSFLAMVVFVLIPRVFKTMEIREQKLAQLDKRLKEVLLRGEKDG